jgi:two-component system cell cycle response regulator DivK
VGQKILVVEDNELNLRLFCDLLRVHGYEAEPVRDGREAVDRARGFAPDLIVMDIQMPHISGLELIDQLKADAELKTIPVMAVTAYAAKGDEERIRDAGAEGYVSKPISVIRFIEAVRELLAAAAARASETTAAEDGISASESGSGESEPETGSDSSETAESDDGDAEPCEAVLLPNEPDGGETSSAEAESDHPEITESAEEGPAASGGTPDLFPGHLGESGHPEEGSGEGAEPDPGPSRE